MLLKFLISVGAFLASSFTLASVKEVACYSLGGDDEIQLRYTNHNGSIISATLENSSDNFIVNLTYQSAEINAGTSSEEIIFYFDNMDYFNAEIYLKTDYRLPFSSLNFDDGDGYGFEANMVCKTQ